MASCALGGCLRAVAVFYAGIVQTVESRCLPKGIEVVSVFVVNGETWWRHKPGKIREENERVSIMEIVVRDRVEWGTDVTVDMTVGLKVPSGQSYPRSPRGRMARVPELVCCGVVSVAWIE